MVWEKHRPILYFSFFVFFLCFVPFGPNDGLLFYLLFQRLTNT